MIPSLLYGHDFVNSNSIRRKSFVTSFSPSKLYIKSQSLTIFPFAFWLIRFDLFKIKTAYVTPCGVFWKLLESNMYSLLQVINALDCSRKS